MTAAVADRLNALLPSWYLYLRAEHRSPQTVKSYGDGVPRFVGRTAEAGRAAAARARSGNRDVTPCTRRAPEGESYEQAHRHQRGRGC